MLKTRLRKILFSLAVVLLLLGGSAAVVPPLLWGDGIDYSSVASIKSTAEYRDTTLLTKAWALPVALLYEPRLDFQKNPSFCGPTSVVNVMRSLQLEGNQSTVLDGSGISTFLGLLPGGMSLDQLGDLARTKLGRKVTVFRDLDLATFREHLRASNDPSRRYVINFSRGPLFGTGGGHHSPIAGYLNEEDLVFVLDVNRKYGPWLVKSDRLYEAMNAIERRSGKKRGLLLIE
jgi:hypothetical protein